MISPGRFLWIQFQIVGANFLFFGGIGALLVSMTAASAFITVCLFGTGILSILASWLLTSMLKPVLAEIEKDEADGF